ncbi:hypothetical protein HMPREF9519_00737 [Enterococcus faecalis TX1346]|nr:hypothetical protein HMPREF9519_00737 [Enterococcus faecalis TX1346]
MSNGKKIFISHSSKDQEYVDAFIQLLKKFGFRTQDIFFIVPLLKQVYSQEN